MKNLFLVYGAALCLLFAYAGFIGWSVADSLMAGTWKPAGRSSTYHK